MWFTDLISSDSGSDEELPWFDLGICDFVLLIWLRQEFPAGKRQPISR